MLHFLDTLLLSLGIRFWQENRFRLQVLKQIFKCVNGKGALIKIFKKFKLACLYLLPEYTQNIC